MKKKKKHKKKNRYVKGVFELEVFFNGVSDGKKSIPAIVPRDVVKYLKSFSPS